MHVVTVTQTLFAISAGSSMAKLPSISFCGGNWLQQMQLVSNEKLSLKSIYIIQRDIVLIHVLGCSS